MKHRLSILASVLLVLGALTTVTVSADDGSDGVVVMVSTHPELGRYLTDDRGHALYLFTNDEDGVSACYGQCAQTWPPLLVGEGVQAGAGLDASLLGTTVRDNGDEQVTYGDWPLYTFARDAEPGTVEGHGLNGVWFLVTAEAAPVEVPAEDEAAAEAEEEEAAEEPVEEDPEALMAEFMNTGGTVFSRNCAVCHGNAGQGGVGPRLDGNNNLNRAGHVISMVLWGQDPGMPAFAPVLSNREVAAVSTYVRNSWSNSFGLVTPSEVDALN